MRSNSIPWGAFFEGVERRCRKEESATAVSPNRSMRKKSKASKKPNSHRQQQSVRCRVALYCLFWFFFFLFFFVFFKIVFGSAFLGPSTCRCNFQSQYVVLVLWVWVGGWGLVLARAHNVFSSCSTRGCRGVVCSAVLCCAVRGRPSLLVSKNTSVFPAPASIPSTKNKHPAVPFPLKPVFCIQNKQTNKQTGMASMIREWPCYYPCRCFNKSISTCICIHFLGVSGSQGRREPGVHRIHPPALGHPNHDLSDHC